MKTSFRFSSQRSALVLGLTLWASALIAGASYAQNLIIPSNMDNAAITIREIFLSPTGIVRDSGASIALDGRAGSIRAGSATIAETVSTKDLNASGNLSVAGAVQFTNSVLRCNVGQWGASGLAGKTDSGTSLTGIANPTNNCLLYTDANGTVKTTNDITPWLPEDNGNVFERTSNNNKWYFADNSGNPKAVNEDNYLSVGNPNAKTQEPQKAEKLDAWLLVHGAVVSRGGMYIKKADNINSNEGTNRNTRITSNYTALDTKVNAGQVIFESERVQWLGNTTSNTTFVFKNLHSNRNANLNVQGNLSIIQPDICTGCEDNGHVDILNVNVSNNRIGVNTPVAQKNLDVRGTAGVSDSLIVGFGAAGANHNPGTDKLKVNGTTRAHAYYYNSDSRYKSDIVPLTSALTKIQSLNGYSYFNLLSEKSDIGVVAQEVEKVFPELVQTDSEGYKSVAYGNLVAPLIEAVKELSVKLDVLFDKYLDQQAHIDELERQVSAHEARLKALENDK